MKISCHFFACYFNYYFYRKQIRHKFFNLIILMQILLLFFIVQPAISIETLYPPYSSEAGHASGDWCGGCSEALCPIDYGSAGDIQTGEMKVRTSTEACMFGMAVAEAYEGFGKLFIPTVTGNYKITFFAKLKGKAGVYSEAVPTYGGSAADTKIWLEISINELNVGEILTQEYPIYDRASSCINPIQNNLTSFDDEMFENTCYVFLVAGHTYLLSEDLNLRVGSSGFGVAGAKAVAFFDDDISFFLGDLFLRLMAMQTWKKYKLKIYPPLIQSQESISSIILMKFMTIVL
jgi:hypothetical protein